MAHSDPTFEAVVAMEIREARGCGVCVRRRELMRGVHICKENKQYPRCRGEKKGFQYDEGES